MISAFSRDGDEIISFQMASGCARPNGDEYGSLCALSIEVHMVWRKKNTRIEMKNKNFCYIISINCMMGSKQRLFKIAPLTGLPV